MKAKPPKTLQLPLLEGCNFREERGSIRHQRSQLKRFGSNVGNECRHLRN
jgi:hypothetical protein